MTVTSFYRLERLPDGRVHDITNPLPVFRTRDDAVEWIATSAPTGLYAVSETWAVDDQ